MKTIDAKDMLFDDLNNRVRENSGDLHIKNVNGQRFIGAGASGRNITIDGVAGNALGAYLNGADIVVNGNAQDAVGDTMNDGNIVVHGNIGDTAGYAMRGGTIYVEKNAGYRTGIHMKTYKEKVPAIVIGGNVGSFLGEYLAGGLILVLGLGFEGKRMVGYFPGTGMHGGKMVLRSDCKGVVFPEQVRTCKATEDDMAEIMPYIDKYCELFSKDKEAILNAEFTVVTPDSSNPYNQMYVAN